jgi:branched-chain amino acid transport system permease protein
MKRLYAWVPKDIRPALFWPFWSCLLLAPLVGFPRIWTLLVIGYIVAAIITVFRFLHGRGTAASAVGAVSRVLHPVTTALGEQRTRRTEMIVFLFFLGLAAAVPFVLNRYLVDVTTLAMTYVLLALGLDLVVGVTGLLVLGYIAFYAIGAYTYALLFTAYSLSFWIALPCGAVTAFLAGLLLGLPVLRIRGDYLAIVTLGFGEITRIVINNWDSFTGGPNGVRAGRPSLGEHVIRDPSQYYIVAVVLVVIAMFVVRRLKNSRVGRAWLAVREDEVAAGCMGINVVWSKLLAFAVGSAFAGVGGVFFASRMTHISPESFTFLESVIVLCMVVVGGMNSIPGVALGALVLIFVPEALRGAATYRMLFFGAAMIAMMIFRPLGFIPQRIIQRRHKFEGREPATIVRGQR